MLLFTVASGGGVALAQPGVAEILRTRVEALAVDPAIDATPIADALFLNRFYESRSFTPAWDSEAKLDGLLQALEGSRAHGLDPADYHIDVLRAYRNGPNDEPGTAIALDILATDALARFAFHLRFGKVNPEGIEPTWNFSRSLEGVNVLGVVQNLIDAPDIGAALRALAPQEPFYADLMQALRSYRTLAQTGGWAPVPSGDTLRPGMVTPRVAALRERLAAEGYGVGDPSDASADPALFDADLEAAVEKFQRLHGLEADGVVGARSLAALNVPVEARIDQLRVNLERVRWIFRDLESRYIIANIARFRTSLVEDGEIVWSTRSVVGRPYRETPVFRSSMTYLVLNPTWTVPPTILREDLLPEIRRDPGTLARRNISVLDTMGNVVNPADVDWNARTFRYMLRQDPGPNNALGRVKFMFPNPYDIYLHDTPARDLFARADRTLSSGCIRLEHPLELAELLLRESGQWNHAAIDRVLAEGRPQTVKLPRPLTVLLIYGTAVPEDGEIYFLPDVYNRDARLLRALDDEFEFTAPAAYQESLGG